ncbi:MAG TPA: beta-ketoacyl synthase N-terminal-like domain-containing protein [Longimicrobium sp.]|nr:beta-ketoacyl synthase N-terminal-like domain-containing protein [Longimicrobium sp.]
MSFEAENYEGVPEVAVIGMSGRFPGADDLRTYWQNIRDGVESITFFSDEELLASGLTEEEISHPDYVKGVGALREIDTFDAGFFGYSPREAEVLEPAHRIFLECAWEAMENAGYDPARVEGSVGVYAGAGNPYYTENNVRGNPELAATVGEFQLAVGSGKDFLATRAAYKMNLRGPAVSVQTGCSTSLVAVHMAAQALLHGECDLALAGGASVAVPHKTGYLYSHGGILSPDGHCRAFDAKSGGAQAGSGVGVVVLKRLEDAVRDGDPIRAVIKGSAINNDGSNKVAYTAPSVEGQAAVVREALEVADVHPETIGYIESHGTGTELGDPIEIAALTQAYRTWTDRKQYVTVSAVKTNIGHLDTAAGIAGFIKAVLALEAKELPPTVHFEAPNPKIDFASSPFLVRGKAAKWEANGTPRRAGVSSFGIGGTNAHIILEEAPEVEPSRARRDTHLLVLSARSGAALDQATANLANHLRANPEAKLAEVAHTLQSGRREFTHRRALVVREGEDAAALLDARQPDRVATGVAEAGHRSVAFLFPGLGDQYVQMARGLYEGEPAFRAEVDRCAGVLRQHMGLDIREVIFPGEAPAAPAPGASAGFDLKAMLGRGQAEADPNAERLNRTELAQPATFVIEYALAKLWESWGVRPEAVIGHSLGEYVAACVAGVFTLEDSLQLVAERARMIQEQPGGSMLAVSLSADAVKPFLVDGAVISTINAPEMCVVAGTDEAVAEVQQKIEGAGHVARKLATTHAFHSPMMDPVVERLAETISRMTLSPPRVPMISNVTGTWITGAEATDPRYWARHLRETVQFDRGAGELLREPGRVLLEVGPGQTLSTFVRQRGAAAADVPVIPSIRYPYDRTTDTAFLLAALGRLWIAGVTPDWQAVHEGEALRRVALPTYPWERQRYWVEAPKRGAFFQPQVRAGKLPSPADWLFVPVWKRTPAVRAAAESAGTVLVFADGTPLASGVVQGLKDAGREVIAVTPGERFASAGAGAYTLRPEGKEDYRDLIEALSASERVPSLVVHLWSVADETSDRGVVSLLMLADAVARRTEPLQVVVVTSGTQEVTGDEEIVPAKAALPGAVRVIPQEMHNVKVRTVDVPASAAQVAALAAPLVAEALSGAGDDAVAYRGRHRWTRGFEPVKPAGDGAARFRQGGVYLFVGGLNGRNETFATHLFETYGARLVLVDALVPHRGAWDSVIKARLEEDPLRIQIERIRQLEAEGAEILTVQALPFEAGQMGDALAQAEARFGQVHGVFFSPLAGHEAGFASISEARPAEWEKLVAHMVQELAGVERGFEGRAFDFFIVESSLTPELGGVGLAKLAADHAVVNAFVQRHNAVSAQVWTGAAWDRWYGEGESAEHYGMSLPEARTVLAHLLTVTGEGVVLLSTGDVEHRMEHAAHLASSASAATQYARPELGNEYFAPTTELEERVAAMWEELLGISPIGIHDDFFGLGGHSLLATQIISRVREMFALELPLKAIFEAPTIAKFSALIEAAIIAEIEALSDEEAMSLVE